MGTRNLTAVYMNGKYRVAQYGQWDGYPEGQGMTCLHFLRDTMNEKEFRKALTLIHFIDEEMLEKILNKFDGAYGFLTSTGSKDLEHWFPEISRNTGAKILELIQRGKAAFLVNRLTFAADSLFCEWAYVIDLDKRTFEVYKGYNNTSLTEDDRFYFLHKFEEKEYSGVKLAHTWSLDDLPSDEAFLNEFISMEETD